MIADEIERGARDAGLAATRLPIREVNALYAALHERYGMVGPGRLWESCRPRQSLHSPDAWKLIEEFVADQHCILLLDPRDGSAAFELLGGKSLRTLLECTYHFEFYVMNSSATYVMCFNHHDVLLAAGEAASWLSRKANPEGEERSV